MGESVVLANSSLTATVDKADYPEIQSFNWFLSAEGYVVRNLSHGGQAYLHRTIMGEPDSLVDHRDRNKLNNQRDNLRLCTHSQNHANSGPKKGRKYKGVHATKNGTFSADICVNGHQIRIGTFKTDEDAARAYNKMALLAWGEFAYMNPVNNG